MSESTLFTFLFLAALPIGLMPGIISLFTRHQARLAILTCNLGAWIAAYFSAKSAVLAPSGFFIPIPIVVLCWVSLFAYAIRPTRTPQTSETLPDNTGA